MNAVVLFSSGLDSTFTLVRSLEAGDHVYPIYVDTCIGDDQKKLELSQVRKITDLLRRRRFSEELECYHVVKADIEGSNDLLLLNQPQAWLYGAVSALGYFKRTIDEVRVSYVFGDQAPAMLDQIRSLWAALGAFFRPNVAHRFPKLAFPCLTWSKDAIAQYLMDRGYDDVLRETYWCEKPIEEKPGVYKTCGECHSCTVMKNWYVYEEKTYEVDCGNEKDERGDFEGLGKVPGLLGYSGEIPRGHKKKTSGSPRPFDFRPDTVPVTVQKKKVEGKKGTVKKLKKT